MLSFQDTKLTFLVMTSMAILIFLNLVGLVTSAWAFYLIFSGVPLLGPEFIYLLLTVTHLATGYMFIRALRTKSSRFVTKAFCIETVQVLCGFVYFWTVFASLLINQSNMTEKTLRKLTLANQLFELTIPVIAWSFFGIYGTVWTASIVLSVLLDKLHDQMKATQKDETPGMEKNLIQIPYF